MCVCVGGRWRLIAGLAAIAQRYRRVAARWRYRCRDVRAQQRRSRGKSANLRHMVAKLVKTGI